METSTVCTMEMLLLLLLLLLMMTTQALGLLYKSRIKTGLKLRVLLRQSDSFAFASAFASSRIAKAEALGLCSEVSGGCYCIFDVLNCEDGVV